VLVKRFVPSAVLLCLLAAGAGAASAQSADVPIPAGTWTFVPEGSDAIDQRIDRAVSHLNFLIRGVARNRLRGANKPVPQIVLHYPDQNVHLLLRSDEPPIITPRSGEFAPYTRADGEVVQVKTELEPGVITQFFDSDDGQKQHVYRLRPDGTMAMEVTVYSDRLREPFTYTWLYRQ
jgi:hypothetical protein